MQPRVRPCLVLFTSFLFSVFFAAVCSYDICVCARADNVRSVAERLRDRHNEELMNARAHLQATVTAITDAIRNHLAALGEHEVGRRAELEAKEAKLKKLAERFTALAPQATVLREENLQKQETLKPEIARFRSQHTAVLQEKTAVETQQERLCHSEADPPACRYCPRSSSCWRTGLTADASWPCWMICCSCALTVMWTLCARCNVGTTALVQWARVLLQLHPTEAAAAAAAAAAACLPTQLQQQLLFLLLRLPLHASL